MFIPISETPNERAILTEVTVRSDARILLRSVCVSTGLSTRRHDNDRKNPRNPRNIYDLNRRVAGRMEQIFLSRGIPVIPTIGKRSEPGLCDSIEFY